MFIGSIFTPWAVVWGAIPVAIAMIVWFWPTGRDAPHRALEKAPRGERMNDASTARRPRRSSGDIDAAALPSFAFGASQPDVVGHARRDGDRGHGFRARDHDVLLRAHAGRKLAAGRAAARLLWGTLNTLILLASCIPNQLAKEAGEREDLRGVRLWHVRRASLFAIAFLVVRAFEFTALNCKWDTNAYGSAVWFLLGLHTTHLITDCVDTVVLAVLMFTGPLEGHRFVDVSENAFYWWFVVRPGCRSTSSCTGRRGGCEAESAFERWAPWWGCWSCRSAFLGLLSAAYALVPLACRSQHHGLVHVSPGGRRSSISALGVVLCGIGGMTRAQAVAGAGRAPVPRRGEPRRRRRCSSSRRWCSGTSPRRCRLALQ